MTESQMLVPDLETLHQFKLDPETMKAAKKLIQDFDTFCKANRIPYFACMAVEETGSKTTYLRTGHSSYQLGVALTDEEITKHIQIAQGAHVFFAETIPEYAEDVNIQNEPKDLIGDVKP